MYRILTGAFSKGVDKEHVMLLAAQASRTENQDSTDATIIGILAEANADIRQVHFYHSILLTRGPEDCSDSPWKVA